MRETQWLQKGLSRRAALQALAVTGVGSILAACAAPATPQATTAPAPAATTAPAPAATTAPAPATTAAPAATTAAPAATKAAATLPANKVLTVAIQTTTYSMDPAVFYGTQEDIIPLNTQEGLVRYKMGTYEFEPALAESWEMKDAGKTWTFKLRQNVKFTDGAKFNAEAAKYEIDRAIKINDAADWLLADYIDKVVADSEYQLTLNLKEPVASYLHRLAMVWSIRFQSPDAYKKNEKSGDLGKGWAETNTAGTGPYKVESFVKDGRIILVKNPDYWRGWKDNQIERIVIDCIPEMAPARMRLDSGDLDMCFLPLQEADYAALSKNAKLNVVKFGGGNNLNMFMKSNRAPTDKKLVRQAMCYAFDYEGAMKAIAGGFADRCGPLPLNSEGDSKELQTYYKYDLNKAKELLAQAGYPNGGLKMKALFSASLRERRMLFEILASDLKKLNCELELNGVDGAVYKEQRTDPAADWNFVAAFWGPDTLDSGIGIYPLYQCKGALDKGTSNLSRLCIQPVDALFQQAPREPDATKRAAILSQIAKGILDEAPAIYAYAPQDVWAYSKAIQNFQYNGFYTMYGARVYDLIKQA